MVAAALDASNATSSFFVVFGEDYPIVGSGFVEPGFVRCPLPEMIVVEFDVRARGAQCRAECFATQRGIDEKSDFFRRL
mgnify:CR=1 FL=1